MLRAIVEDVKDLRNAKKELKEKEISNNYRNQMIKLIGKCQLKIQKKSLIKLTKVFIQTAQLLLMKMVKNNQIKTKKKKKKIKFNMVTKDNKRLK